ncbi:MAG: CPBP family intramembrane metalloprotease, partial [Planctomycetota bacterium]|nr:CPBP family intramembrane metalloprotease [Planctomycetota bacterium]
KFVTVMLFSMTTAMLNLVSTGFTGKQLLAMAPAQGAGGSFDLPPVTTLVWLGVLLVPLSALFSALALALATFAKSSKEGQYYLTPLLMVTMGLTVFCLTPGTELTPQLCLLPVVGPALLLKGLLLSPAQAGSVGVYILPVLVSSCVYSGLALWWAVELFHREEVLFREGERFELVPWLKDLWRTRGELPTFAQAATCFSLIMLLQFFASGWFPKPPTDATSVERGTMMLQQVIMQQCLVIAGPACLMAVALTRNPQRTLRLRGASLGWIAGGAALALCLHPPTVELQERMKWFFGELPPAAKGMFESLGDPEIPIGLLFVAIAVAPAICEELAFRGFILSGFGSRGRFVLAILFSSLMFGAVHMIPQQVLNAGLLGTLLGWMAVRSGSLLPGFAFHLVNNALGLWHGRVGTPWGEAHSATWFADTVGGSLRYSGLTVAVGLAVAVGIVVSLRRRFAGGLRQG